jgi:hypothetical protein
MNRSQASIAFGMDIGSLGQKQLRGFNMAMH